MKYCPYCGTNLLDGAVSFCTECRNVLPGKKRNDEQLDTNSSNLDKKKARPNKQGRKASKRKKVSADETQIVNDDYDGYYDDILPEDEGRQQEGIDQSIITKIVILIASLLAVIGICVALMYLL